MSGKVLYKDKPLVFGTVLLEGPDGLARQANIGKDGSYTATGLAPGTVRVAVNSPNPKNIQLFCKDPDKKPAPYPDAPGWFAIPKKYEKIATSDLTIPLKGGSNAVDIEMK